MPAQGSGNARNYREKELVSSWVVIALDNGTMRNVIDCRCWMSRSGNGGVVVYASIWLYGGNNYYASGRGKDSGYGYDKPSAAIAEAIESAGIGLSESIDGVGNDAVREALSGIAAAMGYDNIFINHIGL
jgi:hypothetical protein